MRTTYDEEADVLAILLADAEVEETRNIAPGVEVDYDAKGRILAIEFLDASKKYDLLGADLEPPDPFYSLAAAGAIYGLSPTTLRHQIQRGVLPGTKLAGNWVVHRDDLEHYIRTRSAKAKSLSEVDRNGAYNLKNRKGEIIFTGSAGVGRLKAHRQRLSKNGDVPESRKYEIRPLSSPAEAKRVEQALIERNKPQHNKRSM